MLPAGLVVVRTAGPFTADTLPAGLRQPHRVAAGTWGCVRVLDGTVGFDMQAEPPIERALVAGDRQALPPGVAHRLVLDGPVTVAVDFLVAQPG